MLTFTHTHTQTVQTTVDKITSFVDITQITLQKQHFIRSSVQSSVSLGKWGNVGVVSKCVIQSNVVISSSLNHLTFDKCSQSHKPRCICLAHTG